MQCLSRHVSRARLQSLVGRALATPWKRRARHEQKVNLELKGFFLPKKSSSPARMTLRENRFHLLRVSSCHHFSFPLSHSKPSAFTLSVLGSWHLHKTVHYFSQVRMSPCTGVSTRGRTPCFEKNKGQTAERISHQPPAIMVISDLELQGHWFTDYRLQDIGLKYYGL